MAKIKWLFPAWKVPCEDQDQLESESIKSTVKAAVSLSERAPEMQVIEPLGLQVEKLGLPRGLQDFLGMMLEVNPEERVSAASILREWDRAGA